MLLSGARYALPRLLLCFLALPLLAGCGGAEEFHGYRIKVNYSVDDPQFRRAMSHLLGPPLEGGNKITPLRNGDEIFPSMLEAIRGAKSTINFETFIYWSGDIGEAFTEALCDRAKAGVKVRILFDAIGSSKIDQDYVKRLRDCGVQMIAYHALSWYDFSSDRHINNRTHRKLLIVDGKIGFTGGVGIADEWSGHAQDKDHWRDMHYRVEGPAVAQLQSAFLDNWIKNTGQVLHAEPYFPPLEQVGDCDAQVFKSGSAGGGESMELLFLLSLATAKKDIRIGNAYFIPDDQTIDALIAASKRGVRVRIIVPGPHLDVDVVGEASRGSWGKLLKEGVEIYEYQPTMYHTKLMIIDDAWVSVGSSNMDNRSFRLNDEANLNVLNKDFAAGQIKVFEDDIAQSKQYTYEDWKHRPWWQRFTESFAQIISPLL